MKSKNYWNEEQEVLEQEPVSKFKFFKFIAIISRMRSDHWREPIGTRSKSYWNEERELLE